MQNGVTLFSRNLNGIMKSWKCNDYVRYIFDWITVITIDVTNKT